MEKLQWEPVGPNGNDPVFFFFLMLMNLTF